MPEATQRPNQEQHAPLLDVGNDGSHPPWSTEMGDIDTTPRSEVAPPVVHLETPGGTAIEATQPIDKGTGYFALPTRAEMAQRSLSAANKSSDPTASTRTATRTGEMDAIVDRSENSTLSGETRPTPQTLLSNLSIESNNSAITVTPIRPVVRSGILPHRPTFPDQSYAALHDQAHPPPHMPSLHRHRTAHQSHILTFTSALASTHQSGSRTAVSSPALTSSHGLFNPNTANEQRNFDSAENLGTYASPFLHFTHRQVPKETHVADVDVDTVSGRKVINHYEIVDELGRGTHGKVKLGRDLTTKDTYVAIKIVERYSKRRKLGKLGQAEDKVKKEVAILKKARHPNIVALLEVIDDPTRKKVYIVLEWVSRGEIHWRAKTQFKEIAILEARRYERERHGLGGPEADAEHQALLAEVQQRLIKKARHELRKFRRGLRDAPNAIGAFSYEMVGDHETEDEDDRSSRMSTTTAESLPRRGAAPVESRLPSRPETPLFIADSPVTPASDSPEFLSLTPDITPLSPIHIVRKMSRHRTGFEGPMHGSYDPSSEDGPQPNSVADGHLTAEELAKLAQEILDSELNTELEYVPVMTMQQARVAFRDTLLGLQYLHAQGIVHRDIKPPNLLSTRDHRVKISDFGVSYLGRPIHEGDAPEDVSEHEAQELDEAKELAKTVGTPAFYAPELCITENNDDPLPVTKAIDVWALGVTLFCMIFARTPFVDSEFVVMRQIADEEVYVPRKRLAPVVLKSPSRPTSHHRSQSRGVSGRRPHGEIFYEDIDDTLHDLLKRLLTRDPRCRITLEEVRHHPWILTDLPDKAQWLEETDLVQSTQSQRIEVSKEDVNTAVVPLQFLDRVRSGIKKVGERLGLASKAPGRPRTSSNASHGCDASPSVSANSSSSNISQDVRRQSLRGDETIFSALQRSREVEHPLSKSVAASPDLNRRESFFDTVSFTSSSDRELADAARPLGVRPLPERSKTIVSTAESVRTLKQSDIPGRYKESPPPSPGLPGTPIALESPGGNGLSAIFGSGPARRVLRTLRERSSAYSPALRASSRDRGSVESFDPHGEPSLAISNTSVEGHVNLPEALQVVSQRQHDLRSFQNSPNASRPQSGAASPRDNLEATFPSDDMMTRASSASSFQNDDHLIKEQDWQYTRDRNSVHGEVHSENEAWQRGEDERIRKLRREAEDAETRPVSSNAMYDRACPPSPDDFSPTYDIQTTSKREQDSNEAMPHDLTTSRDVPGGPAIISSSSEFGSAVSMSVSNPSMPSASSENSSLQPIDIMFKPSDIEQHNDSSDGTLQSPTEVFDSGDDGYRQDLGSSLNSDEEDEEDEDSSDSDDGLIMLGKRSKQGHFSTPLNYKNLHAGDVGNDGQESSISGRAKKSSRSGSNNTMKKVHSGDSEDDH